MILVVIVVVGVAVQVLHLSELRGIGLVGQQVGGVEAVVVGVHHLRQTRDELVARVERDVDLCGHALVALGLDEEHAVGTLRTIESSTVLQHGDGLDVVDVQVCQQVVEVAVVEHGARVLHVHDDTVDDDERLGVGVQGVDALNEHEVTQAGDASVADAAHIGTQLLGDQRVDAQLRVVVEAVGLGADGGMRRLGILTGEVLRVELGVGHSVSCAVSIVDDGVLLEAEAFESHGDRPCVVGHFQFIESLLVSHGAVAWMSVSHDDNTRQRFSCGGIDDGASDCLRVLLRHCHSRAEANDERQDEIFDAFSNHICVILRSSFSVSLRKRRFAPSGEVVK